MEIQDSACLVLFLTLISVMMTMVTRLAGAAGTILRTTNGGSTWEKVTTNFTDTLKRVDFADDKNGWIVAMAATFLHSNDTGKTLDPTGKRYPRTPLRPVYGKKIRLGCRGEWRNIAVQNR